MASSSRSLGVVSILVLLSAAAGWAGGTWYAGRPSRVARRFNEIYWERKIPQNLTFWLDIPTQQTPTDLWTIQQILYEVKPEFVIETGTLNGGSALYHAMVLREINPQARALTIDIEPHVGAASQYGALRRWWRSSPPAPPAPRRWPRFRSGSAATAPWCCSTPATRKNMSAASFTCMVRSCRWAAT